MWLNDADGRTQSTSYFHTEEARSMFRRRFYYDETCTCVYNLMGVYLICWITIQSGSFIGP